MIEGGELLVEGLQLLLGDLELPVARLQPLLRGLQLLIARPQLLLRVFQLLIARLVLFVDRHGFFVDRLMVLVGDLEVADGASELLAGGIEVLLERGRARAGGFGGARPPQPFGLGLVDEAHEHQLLALDLGRPHADADRDGRSVADHLGGDHRRRRPVGGGRCSAASSLAPSPSCAIAVTSRFGPPAVACR